MFSIAGAITSLPYIFATVGLLLAYNAVFDNPSVRREARKGYVLETSLAALEAERNELQRQRDAAQRAAASWQDQLERFQQDIDQKQADLDERIAAYEKDNVGRCELSGNDLEFLRK